MEATRAVNRAQITTAAKGGTNAQKAHFARHDRIAQKIEDTLNAELEGWEGYVRLCENALDGLTPEQRTELEKVMLPHPDDVEVDFGMGEVRILGPTTSLQRRHLVKA